MFFFSFSFLSPPPPLLLARRKENAKRDSKRRAVADIICTSGITRSTNSWQKCQWPWCAAFKNSSLARSSHIGFLIFRFSISTSFFLFWNGKARDVRVCRRGSFVCQSRVLCVCRSFLLGIQTGSGYGTFFLESFACKMVKEREEVLEKKRKENVSIV